MNITFTRDVDDDTGADYTVRVDFVVVGYVSKIPGTSAWIGHVVGARKPIPDTYPTRRACADAIVDAYTRP